MRTTHNGDTTSLLSQRYRYKHVHIWNTRWSSRRVGGRGGELKAKEEKTINTVPQYMEQPDTESGHSVLQVQCKKNEACVACNLKLNGKALRSPS
jgi:hypothetical protein